MTAAMREQDARRLSVLRMLSAALKNKEIERRGSGKEAMSDEEMMDVLRTEIKRRNDASEGFRRGGRNDLAEKEVEEARILAEYAPAEVGDDIIADIVRDIIAASDKIPGPKEFGRVMGAAIQRLKGQASGERVSAIVRRALGG